MGLTVAAVQKWAEGLNAATEHPNVIRPFLIDGYIAVPVHPKKFLRCKWMGTREQRHKLRLKLHYQRFEKGKTFRRA